MKQLKDILSQLYHKASVPDKEQDWQDILSQLNEKMPAEPEKKKRRPIWLLFPALLAASLILWFTLTAPLTGKHKNLLNEESASAIQNDIVLAKAQAGHDSGYHNNTAPGKFRQTNQQYRSQANTAVNTDPAIAGNKPSGSQQADKIIPEQKIQKETEPADIAAKPAGKRAGAHDTARPEIASSVIVTAEPARDEHSEKFTEKSVQDSNSLAALPVKDKDTAALVKKNTDSNKDDKKQKHLPAVGFVIGYGVNAYTAHEQLVPDYLVNYMLQFTKQLNYTLYYRIPLSPGLQVQPFLGLENVSSNVQVNYICEGCRTITRYDINRVKFLRSGFDVYTEPYHNLYVYGGVYGGILTRAYSATKSEIKIRGQNEDIISQSTDRKDERKSVFDLRSYDMGLSAGIEYLYRRRTTFGIRLQQGFADITPQTPQGTVPLQVSFRIGYHLERKSKTN